METDRIGSHKIRRTLERRQVEATTSITAVVPLSINQGDSLLEYISSLAYGEAVPLLYKAITRK